MASPLSIAIVFVMLLMVVPLFNTMQWASSRPSLSDDRTPKSPAPNGHNVPECGIESSYRFKVHRGGPCGVGVKESAIELSKAVSRLLRRFRAGFPDNPLLDQP